MTVEVWARGRVRWLYLGDATGVERHEAITFADQSAADGIWALEVGVRGNSVLYGIRILAYRFFWKIRPQ